VWRWDQAEPFGSNPANEDPDSNTVTFDLPLRLPGQRYDAETALHYNYFRDYDPSIGRYGESDPIGLGGGLNTYAYVLGDPLLMIDVKGLMSNYLCCQTSKKLGQHLDPRTGEPDTGWPICCQGRKVACTDIGPVGFQSPMASGVLETCVEEHEKFHFPVLEKCDCSVPGIKRLDAPGINRDAEECAAYIKTTACLRRNMPKCGQNKRCISEIQSAIDASERQASIHCSVR
jgi:RHS repeat-associated protein